jgi:hypothetical protein
MACAVPPRRMRKYGPQIRGNPNPIMPQFASLDALFQFYDDSAAGIVKPTYKALFLYSTELENGSVETSTYEFDAAVHIPVVIPPDVHVCNEAVIHAILDDAHENTAPNSVIVLVQCMLFDITNDMPYALTYRVTFGEHHQLVYSIV